jgi:hypothetical protein
MVAALTSWTTEYFEPNAKGMSTIARNARRAFIWLSLCFVRCVWMLHKLLKQKSPIQGAFPVVEAYDFQHSGSKKPFL